jgi:NADH-quinone oxidoreductase subunit C
VTEEKRKPTPEEKARAAAEAKAKAEALRKMKEEGQTMQAGATEAVASSSAQDAVEAQPEASTDDPAKAAGNDEADAKAKAAAAAKAKAAAAAAAAAKAKAAREAAESGAAAEAGGDDADAKAKAAAAAKAKAAAAAAAAAKAKAAGAVATAVADGDDDAKAKAAAAAKAKAAAAAAAKAKAAEGETAEAEAVPKAPSKNQPYLDKYVQRITEKFGADVIEAAYINELAKDVPTLVIKNESWHDVARFLKEDDQLAFDYLSNLHGVDYEDRMEVYYHFYSYKNRQSLAVKVKTNREAPSVASVMDIWSGANWNERETFDLLGIYFPGHTDLRRIMLPDDWVGHPLRKDYVQYDEEV